VTLPAQTPPESETKRARQALAQTEAQDALEERKKLHLVAAKISEMNWGKGLSNEMQRAVAMYCRQSLIDPTEIDVLGGNVYRNSRYYLRRLSEMVEDGLVDYAKPDHVEADPRLEQLAKGEGQEASWARSEIERRRYERIQHAIPEAAVSAVVFRVKLKTVPVEFTSAKWCGGGTRKSDPVGDSFPVETSETRACRRVMRYIASQIPHLKWREEELDDKGLLVTARMADERSAAALPTKVDIRESALNGSGHVRRMPMIGDDPYTSPGMKPALGPGDPVPTTVVSRPPENVATTQIDTSDLETPDDDLVLDQQLLDDEARQASPPGSKSHTVPGPGKIQDALDLNDQPKRRNRNAQLD